MKSRAILLSGSCTGILVAIFVIIVFVIGSVDPGSFELLFGGFLFLSALSGIIVNLSLKKLGMLEIDLKILTTVGLLTSIIPMFGPVFGGPELSNLSYWMSVPLIAGIGGFFWSIPFAIWNYYINK